MAMLFSLSNLLVMPFWLLMIVLPGWRWTEWLVRSPLIVLGPVLLYAVLALPQAGALLPALANPSLAAVRELLGSELGATIAWAHFLAFDLFVGRWIYLRARERGIHPLLVAPVLFFTLMLGPVGLLLFLLELRFLPAPRPAARPLSAEI